MRATTPFVARRAILKAHLAAILLWTLGPLLFLVACAYRRIWVGRRRVVVVVGSFGKSTTARLLSCALGCSAVTDNFLPHVALAILRLRRGDSPAVFEAGISRKRQMRALALMLRPDVVVVTSIGGEHLKSFGSLEAIRAEKVRMVEALRPDGLAVLNGDDPNVLWMAARTPARVIRCGQSQQNSVRDAEVSFHYPPKMAVRVICGEAETLVTAHLASHGAVFAILAAWTVAREEQISEAEFLRRIERSEAVERRMQPVRLACGAWGIVDDRKAVPETITVALQTLADLPAERKWIILGDIGGNASGMAAELQYRTLGAELARVGDRVVLMTPDARKRELLASAAVQAGLPATSIEAVAGNLSATVEHLRRQLRPGDVVLIKGRFHERLVRIALALEGLDVGCSIPYCKPRRLECRRCPALAVGPG